MTKIIEIPQPTRASEYRRKRKPFVVRLSADLTVLMKPVDMTEAFLANLIPMPGSGVKAKFEEMEKRIDAGEVVPMAEIFGSEDDEHAEENMQTFLRKYACIAVVEPKIVLEDDGNPDHIPASELTRFELLNIWNAEPDGKEPPVIAPERVEEFRGEPGGEKPADGAPLLGEDLRSETKLVDLGDREVITA